jgi:hypothetical protein
MPTSPSATTSSSIPDVTEPWYALFNRNAPGPGWTPGFGASAAPLQAAAPPPDTTPPTVSVAAPTGGTTLLGTITFSASAADDDSVASVQFAVDGNDVGAPIATAPYDYDWDSTSLTDGSHTITASAQDGAGNSTTSDGVTITTLNEALAIAELGITAQRGDSSSQEVISWTTNQLSTSKVIYGLNGSYASSTESATLTTNHSITLNGITGGTWKYKVVSTNAAGATATSSEQQFIVLIFGFDWSSLFRKILG